MVDGMDPTMVTVLAVGVGGLALAAAQRFLGGGDSAPSPEEAKAAERELMREEEAKAASKKKKSGKAQAVAQPQSEGGSKKKKKKKKGGSGGGAAAAPSAGAASVAAPPAPEEPAPTVRAPTPVPEPVAAAPSPSSKSKKKKKKKGGAGGGDTAAQQQQQQQQQSKAKKTAAEKKAKAAAEAAEAKAAAEAAAVAAAAEEAAAAAAAEEESAWSTVKKRKKKKPAAAAAGEVSVSDDGRASATVEIGEYAPKLIGPGGATIRSLQEDTGAKVDLDKVTKTATITGTSDAVNAAQDFIISLLANQKKDLMDLDAKRGLVFAQIRRIQEESGARLDLERGSSILELSGEVAAVAKAREMVSAILDSTDVGTIALDTRDIPCIIGKGGSNIRAIQAESGATLDIDSDIGIVSVTGTPEQVAKASDLVQQYVLHRGPPPEAIEKLPMSSQAARLVIGAGGSNVQRLEKESGARIKIDLASDGSESMVTVSGDTGAVQAGAAAVRKLIADHSHEVTIELESSGVAKAILGAGGENIKRIRESSQARIDLTDLLVTVRGTKQQVDSAKALIDEAVAEEVGAPKVPPGHELFETELGGATGKIIGGAGSNIQRLQETHNVKIKIKRSTYCYVVGPPEGVAGAKKEIEETLRRHEEAVARIRAQEEEAARLAAEAAAEAAAAAEAQGDDEDDDDDEEEGEGVDVNAGLTNGAPPPAPAAPAAVKAAPAPQPTQAPAPAQGGGWDAPPGGAWTNEAWGNGGANGTSNWP